MKTRGGYVSNSSSSSFVLMSGDVWSSVTADDIAEAIRSRIGDYDEKVEAGLKRCESIGIDRSELELGGELFVVFDLAAEDGRKKAEECLGCRLDEWISEWMRTDGNDLKRADMTGARIGWERECRDIGGENDDGYRLDGWSLRTPSAISRCSISRYDENSDRFDLRPLPDPIREHMMRRWKETGLCTNADVMRSPESRFVIHFAENVLSDVLGMQDEGGDWDTLDMTEGRFLEILTEELTYMGKIPWGTDWRQASATLGACCLHEG